MPALWTTPKTWNTGEPLTAADLNTHLRDNLEYLKDKPSGAYLANEFAVPPRYLLFLSVDTIVADMRISVNQLFAEFYRFGVFFILRQQRVYRINNGSLAAWVGGMIAQINTIPFEVLD